MNEQLNEKWMLRTQYFKLADYYP